MCCCTSRASPSRNRRRPTRVHWPRSVFVDRRPSSWTDLLQSGIRRVVVEGLNLRYGDLFITVGTNSVAEVGAGVLVDVLLDDLPVIVIVADFIAVHTNWQELFQLPHLRRKSDDALRHPQPDFQFLTVQRLGQE